MTWFVDPVAFWLIGMRLTGMVLMVPTLSQMPMPVMVRMGFVLWLTIGLQPTLPTGVYPNLGPFDLAIAMAAEFLFGLALGFIARLIFSIVEIGGAIVDTDLGFRAAEQFNPSMAITGAPMTRFYLLIAMAAFWIFDYTGIMILAVRESLLLVPPFALANPFEDASQVFKLVAGLFTSAIMLAAPIMAVMFAVTIGVGFMARAVQGINFLYEVFAIRILGGVASVLLFLPLTMIVMRDQMARIIPNVHLFMTSLAGRAAV